MTPTLSSAEKIELELLDLRRQFSHLDLGEKTRLDQLKMEGDPPMAPGMLPGRQAPPETPPPGSVPDFRNPKRRKIKSKFAVR